MYTPFVLGPQQARDVRTWPASLQSQVLSFLAPPELAAWSAASVVQHQPTLGRLPFEVLSSPLKLCLAIQKTAGLWCWQRRVTGKSDEAERHPATNFREARGSSCCGRARGGALGAFAGAEPTDTVQDTATQPAAVQETVLDTVTVPDSVLELGGFLDPEIPERREL